MRAVCYEGNRVENKLSADKCWQRKELESISADVSAYQQHVCLSQKYLLFILLLIIQISAYHIKICLSNKYLLTI